MNLYEYILLLNLNQNIKNFLMLNFSTNFRILILTSYFKFLSKKIIF